MQGSVQLRSTGWRYTARLSLASGCCPFCWCSCTSRAPVLAIAGAAQGAGEERGEVRGGDQGGWWGPTCEGMRSLPQEHWSSCCLGGDWVGWRGCAGLLCTSKQCVGACPCQIAQMIVYMHVPDHRARVPHPRPTRWFLALGCTCPVYPFIWQKCCCNSARRSLLTCKDPCVHVAHTSCPRAPRPCRRWLCATCART